MSGLVSAVVVRDLSVSFRDRTALSGVDLVAQPGRRIGLVGENGTGKSTLLRAVAGRLPAAARVSGTIEAPRGADLVLLGPGAAVPRRPHGRRGARSDLAAAAGGGHAGRAAGR